MQRDPEASGVEELGWVKCDGDTKVPQIKSLVRFHWTSLGGCDCQACFRENAMKGCQKARSPA